MFQSMPHEGNRKCLLGKKYKYQYTRCLNPRSYLGQQMLDIISYSHFAQIWRLKQYRINSIYSFEIFNNLRFVINFISHKKFNHIGPYVSLFGNCNDIRPFSCRITMSNGSSDVAFVQAVTFKVVFLMYEIIYTILYDN